MHDKNAANGPQANQHGKGFETPDRYELLHQLLAFGTEGGIVPEDDDDPDLMSSGVPNKPRPNEPGNGACGQPDVFALSTLPA